MLGHDNKAVILFDCSEMENVSSFFIIVVAFCMALISLFSMFPEVCFGPCLHLECN